jgi:hypothetical protein
MVPDTRSPFISLSMSWSLKFDEPIELANGRALYTLRDAGDYLTALPKRKFALSHWQIAASCLLQAADKGGRLVMMARVAMVRALNGGRKVTPAPSHRNRYDEPSAA